MSELDNDYWLKKYNRAAHRLFQGALLNNEDMCGFGTLTARQLGTIASNIASKTGQDITEICADLACEAAEHAMQVHLAKQYFIQNKGGKDE